MVDNKDRNPEREKYLAEFGERYQKGFEELLESLEELGSEPLAPNPASLDINDERDFEELDNDEIGKVKSVLYQALGIDSDNTDFEIRKYETEADPQALVPGKVEIRVLKTNRENVFLQEMTFVDGALRWVVGSDQNI